MENDLLYVSLDKYYKDKDKSKYLLKYLKYEKISLRIIDWFVTNYSKKYDTIYDINIVDDNITLDHGRYSKQFNVFRSYKAQLKSFSKRNFDPFCRRNRIDYIVKGVDDVDIKINTTIGQLNFFRWAIDNLVIEYILKNYDIIEDDMNTSIKNIRKNYIKTSERKQRQELSLSASRGLTRHRGKHIVRFD
tara:strand:- start:15 stop:584 length:570 start_codon:yes stop_codon:yes gene_type:complete